MSAGSQVETGAPLVRLEPVGDGDEAAAAPRPTAVDLDLPGPTGPRPRIPSRGPRPGAATSAPCCSASTSTRTDDGGTLHGLPRRAGPSWRAGGRSPWPASSICCEAFADFAELSRNRPARRGAAHRAAVHSPREHFHTYLQSLDVDRGGLPDEFRERLAPGARALRRDRARPHPRAGGGRVPRLPRPAALRPRTCRWSPRLLSAGSPSRRRRRTLAQTCREVLDRLGRRDPAALPGRR